MALSLTVPDRTIGIKSFDVKGLEIE